MLNEFLSIFFCTKFIFHKFSSAKSGNDFALSFWTSPGYLDNRFILIVSSCFEPDVEAPISANHFTQFSLFNSALFSIFLEFLYGQQLESEYVYFLSFYIGVSPSKDEFPMKTFLKL